MKRPFAVALLCWATMICSASAEQIYLRNRPFRGPVQGKGKSIQVGMIEFAQAMGLKVSEQGGAQFLTLPEVEGNDFGVVSDPGGVYVIGRRVETTQGPAGEVMIPLWESAQAAGFRVQPNPSLGTIDVNLAPAPKISMPEPAPEEQEVASNSARRPVKRGTVPGQETDFSVTVGRGLPPRNINKPGAAVNVEQHLVAGRTNLVVFGATW